MSSNSTICYSAINPRKIKEHPVISPVVGTLECIDEYKIIDVKNEIVEVRTKVRYVDEYDTDKMANSFKGQTGIKAIAGRVAMHEVGTIYDDKGDIVDATKLPTNLMETQDIINAGKQAKENMAKLPTAITKNQSAEDFVKNYKEEDVINYVKSMYEKSLVSTEGKEAKEEHE